MLKPKYGLERTSSEPPPEHPSEPKHSDISLVKKQWVSSGGDPDDKSGTAIFTVGALEVSVPLSDSRYFFDLADLFEIALREARMRTVRDVEARIYTAIQREFN